MINLKPGRDLLLGDGHLEVLDRIVGRFSPTFLGGIDIPSSREILSVTLNIVVASPGPLPLFRPSRKTISKSNVMGHFAKI